jgi:nicotinamide riboside kinase
MEKDSIRSMKKVTFTGVESSGKTVLAQSIAEYYKCPLVEEYSRIYLKDKGLDYQQADLLSILQGQFDMESEVIMTNPDLMVCDTGPIVIKVWSLFKYGSVDPRIEQAVKSYRADLFIIPNPEGVPFRQGPLRENPNDRDQLFQMYLAELIQLDMPFLIAHGSFEERLNQVRDAIDSLLS